MMKTAAAAVLTVAAVAAVATAVTPAQATMTMSTPRWVHAVSATPTTMTFRWGAVSGAREYRVMFSTGYRMTSRRYADFTGPSGVIRRLSPKQRYWFRVAVINPRTGARLSSYTATSRRPGVTAGIQTPAGLRVADTGTSTAGLAWTAGEGVARWRVATSTSPTFATSTYTQSATPTARLTGLRPGTRYYFRVQAASGTGAGLSPYSAATSGVMLTTAPTAPTVVTSSGPADVRVGSFNVMTASGDRAEGNRLPWAQRRAAVVGDILGERVDVIGVQEVNQSYGLTSRMVNGANQFLDLKNGLNEAGGTYALTNEFSYNCVNPKSSYRCAYRYQGASGGDRIYFNTSTLRMVSQGSYAYPTQNPATVATVTYALAYAVLEVKATGARFLFTSTHLDPPDRAVRVAQWKEMIAKVNQLKGSLPVVNVGDFNTQKFDPITATMLPAMKAAGYGDVLNQSYATNPAVNPRAEKTVNGWVNSLNRYNRDVRTYSYPYNHTKTGNSIDWIFASNWLPVREFKMVSNFDPTSLQVQGTMPSDHNMLRATLTLR